MSTNTDQNTNRNGIGTDTETFVEVRYQGNSGIVHVPDDTADDPEPLCGTHRNVDREWREVPLTTRPEAWRTWCKRCRHIVEYGKEPAGEGR